MKPICFIAARGGSKGVKGKNIKKLGDKPLIAYTIESARKSKIFSHVIVSTEDKLIAKIAKQFGAKVPFQRPRILAADNASFDDVLLHGIKKLRDLGYDFDVVVNRDCTVPFIKNSDIIGALKLQKEKKCHTVCGVYRQHHNPYFNMMEINKKGFLRFSKKTKKKIISRQDAPIVFQLNGLFVIDVNRFLKYRKLYMPKTLPFEIPLERGFMIDTKFEFEIANLLAKNKVVPLRKYTKL